MDAILRENTPLIWSIARRFFGRGAEGEDTLLDLLPAPGEEEPLLDRMDLLRAMDTLEPRLRRVVALRYGRELTQQRTADLLGISQVQVSRLEKKALALLRAQMAAP